VPGEEGAPADTGADVPGRFLGILTMEGRPEVFLCQGGSYPVDGPAFPDLVELHASLTPGVEPLEEIFVDVLGELREDGGGAWLDALEVRRAAYEGWGCRGEAERFLYQASGTEPFWSLTVEEASASWRTPEGVRRFVHEGPYRLPRGGVALDGRDESGAAVLEVEFQDEPCRDAMSGAYSHLTVRVRMEGVELRGCGFQGPFADSGS
jgi:uncharacterized membrane protein